MGEYAAPFSTEGFISSPDTELNELLTVLQEKKSPGDEEIQVSLLKDLLSQERSNLDELVYTAKQLNPVIQKVAPLASAYDAAFESSVEKAIPVAGATLQGFALLLLVISYVCLLLVSVISVNIITGNPVTAGKVLVALLSAGFLGFAILIWYG